MNATRLNKTNNPKRPRLLSAAQKLDYAEKLPFAHLFRLSPETGGYELVSPSSGRLHHISVEWTAGGANTRCQCPGFTRHGHCWAHTLFRERDLPIILQLKAEHAEEKRQEIDARYGMTGRRT